MVILNISLFNKNKSSKDGLNNCCKKCCSIINKNRYIKKQNEIKQKCNSYYHNIKNTNDFKKKQNIRNLNNKENQKEYQKEYRKNNKIVLYENLKKWKEKNKDHVKIYQKEYQKEYRKNNPHLTIYYNILKRCLTYTQTKKLNKIIIELGYSPNQLKEHLNKQGIKWGKDQVDHKIPLTWFKETTPAYIVNDLRNLQPLLTNLNILKSNKYMNDVDKEYLNIVKPHIKNEYLRYLSSY